MPSGIYIRTPEIRKKLSEGQKKRDKSTVNVSGIRNLMNSARKKGEENCNWKGNSVKYVALHQWVARILGKPDSCSQCKKSGLKGRKIHWANISHKYKRELSDWVRLCVSCHKFYDKGKLQII